MTPPPNMRAIVLGAGVSGLTSAVVLADNGFDVRVLAAQPSHHTVSAVAGASWGPFLGGHDRVIGWSLTSLRHFADLARRPGTGVQMVAGLEVCRGMTEVPGWAEQVSDFQPCPAEDLPTGYTLGWRYTIPIVDTPVYLTYLATRLAAAGIAIEIIPPITSLPELTEHADLVVNCTGLGAAELVPDPKLRPNRGQLVITDNPGVTDFFQDNVDSDHLTCIFPEGDRVVLGGISEPGSTDLGIDLDIADQILRRCVAVEPRLADATVLGHRVGLRPQRSEIRVEPDAELPHRLLHNYGHGGSGVTLSWGCAYEVLALAHAARG